MTINLRGYPAIPAEEANCGSIEVGKLADFVVLDKNPYIVPGWELDALKVLFEKVRIFDGKDSVLSEPSHVLVRDNKMERI